MKKILAALLIALMLLGSLPFTSAPAKAEIDFTIVCSVSYAHVGEAFFWFAHNVQGGSEPYRYAFNVYKDGEYFSGEGLHYDNSRAYEPPSPGRYKVYTVVMDKYGNQRLKFSNEINVYERLENKITRVEPLGPTSLKITWKKVPGAAEYLLYRSTSPNTGWTWIKTTTGTSFSNTYLNPGTRYFYRVEYYRAGLITSGYSSAVSGVPMAKTAITSITSPAKGQVRLVWSKAAGASGYQVLMATSSNGTYKSVRILNGTTVTFSGLKSGSTLYFKVRPYRKVYTTTYWGQYSPQRGIRIK